MVAKKSGGKKKKSLPPAFLKQAKKGSGKKK